MNDRFSYRDEDSSASETDMEFVVNDNNKALWRAAKKMGIPPERIPRNVKGNGNGNSDDALRCH